MTYVLSLHEGFLVHVRHDDMQARCFKLRSLRRLWLPGVLSEEILLVTFF